MARKLGFGAGMTFVACTLLAGCETGSNSRLANNTTPSGGSVAKQGSPLPPPSPASPSSTGGFRTTSSTGSGGFSTATSNNAFTNSLPNSPNMPANFSSGANPASPNMTPLNTNAASNNLSGTQNTGVGSTNNRSVTATQPAPELPPIVPPPPTSFTNPGISSISAPALPTPQ